MPGCCAYNCSQRTEKGVRLFKLPQGPKNSDRRKQWINNINRTNLPEEAFVCENHFTHDQFENNRQDNKRPLRWNAIPTLFSHKIIPTPRKPPKVRIDNTIIKVENVSDCDRMIEDPIELHLLHQDDLQRNSSVQEETHPRILELQRKLQLAYKTIRNLKEENKTLKKQANTIFNKDQIRCLRKGKMTGNTWESDTIRKSLKLYLSCGKIGYEELRKQNYPLPGIRTLQKRIENFKFRPGILEDKSPLLQIKMEGIKPEERHAVFSMDQILQEK